MSGPPKNRGVESALTVEIGRIVCVAHIFQFFIIKPWLDADFENQGKVYLLKCNSFCPSQSVSWVDHALQQGGCLKQETNETNQFDQVSRANKN